MIRAVSVLTLLASLSALAQAPQPTDWHAFDMLLGDWTADDAGGAPGAATSATFSFTFDLDRRILVRRDHSEYGASAARPASHHDGLLVLSSEPSGKFAAISFDNEGHVIPYDVDTGTAGRIILISPARGGEPRYRLSYETTPRGLLVTFAIAPPNRPDAFVEYVKGTARRVEAAGGSPEVAELTELEARWNNAHLRGDGDALDRLWADDLEVAAPKMPIMTRRDALAFARSGRMRFARYETSELRFRIYGDSAVVTGRLRRSRSINGREVDDDWRFSKMYVRQGGAWKVVAFHASESAP